MKRVVSIPVHESEVAALDLCLNYILVGEVDAVVLHVNALTETFDIEKFELLVHATEPLRGKVFVNRTRVPMPFIQGSTQFVGFIYRAHLANFLFIRRYMDFDWFITDASNSLIVRRGLSGYIAGDRDGIDVSACNPDWEWLPHIWPDPIWEMFDGDLCQSNIEGMFFSTKHFTEMLAGFVEYEKRLRHAQEVEKKALYGFPREEILFPTLHRRMFGPEASKAPFTWMRWSTRLVWTENELERFLIDQHLQIGKYGIKRVGRTPDDWIRVRTSRYYDYRHLTEAAVARFAAMRQQAKPPPRAEPPRDLQGAGA